MRALFTVFWMVAGLGSARAEPDGFGVTDVGIFPELSAGVSVEAGRADGARVDLGRGVLVLYRGTLPVGVWPHRAQKLAIGQTRWREAETTLGLRPADATRLAKVLAADAPVAVVAGDPKRRPEPGDRDGDGIPDPLDVLVGARKLISNGADYHEAYRVLAYPGGDVPRSEGVCTDTVIRALRNAGLDLQQAVHEDIVRARKAYPMVKKPNRNIDHRRVKTLLPYFRRHLRELGPDEPLLAGDVIFMDTFPSRSGPDHIGVVSDRVSDDGRPLVINNWTDGAKDSEMDLLSFVPVLHRFRLAPANQARASR